MLTRIGFLVVAVALLVPAWGASPILASGGNGGGGGTPKPLKVVYIGYITHLEEVENGILMTVGTSYYNVAANILITPDTKVKYNGSSISAFDLEFGDYVEVTVTWPSKVATKVEAVGAP